ncbi:MAG: hypothetical protein AAGE01_15765 [Pseudomonadota bacterium]
MIIRKLAVAAALAAFAAVAPAQEAAEQPEITVNASPEMFAELKAMQDEMQTLNSRLTTIQTQAFEQNPEIVAEQQAWQALVMQTMGSGGLEVETAMQRVQEMQAKLQSGELDEEQQQATLLALQQESQVLQEAHQAAIQSEPVLAAGAKLEERILAAMKAIDPASEQLIAELREKEATYQAAVMAAMQNAQQGQ